MVFIIKERFLYFNIGLSNGFGDVKTLVQFVNGLRAVAELHSPVYFDFPDDDTYCKVCVDETVPCKTIRAIIEELNG